MNRESPFPSLRPRGCEPNHSRSCERSQQINDLEEKVYNATIDIRLGGTGDRASTLTLSLETSHAILTEAWEKFHEARVELNELADQDVAPEYAFNRVMRLAWATDNLKRAIDAIYALTPLPEDDSDA